MKQPRVDTARLDAQISAERRTGALMRTRLDRRADAAELAARSDARLDELLRKRGEQR